MRLTVVVIPQVGKHLIALSSLIHRFFLGLPFAMAAQKLARWLDRDFQLGPVPGDLLVLSARALGARAVQLFLRPKTATRIGPGPSPCALVAADRGMPVCTIIF